MTARHPEVGEWVKTVSDDAVTNRAIQKACELGWDEGSYDEWLAFVSGFRQGALSVTDLRSHEPPRNKPGELEHDPQPSARRD